MVDWSLSMQQTFEYYIVDPGTWKDSKRVDNVKSCTITRDSGAETLGSASFNVVDLLGECYIRVYLVTIQNGIKEKWPLGTFLVQTPSSTFDGKSRNVTMDAYTPLLELKENPTPLGYYISKKKNIIETAYMIVREHVRAPVVKTSCPTNLFYDFVANTDDTWLSYISDLIANAEYKFDLDDLGRILFAPDQDTASLQPVFTYNDDNSSILCPDLSCTHDIFGVPNVVEVIYSDDTHLLYSKAINDDPSSPTSVPSRGRVITERSINPDLGGIPNQTLLDKYANDLLKELSSIEYTVSYSHGYCPVRVGDCVRINYTRSGFNNVKAKVVSQTIDCKTGCTVSETAVFTTKLWR